MTPEALLETAVLLGLFVAAGGAYASLYSIGRLRTRPWFTRAGLACWVFAVICAGVIAIASPLEIGWKLLILASAVVYVVIPPLTWHYLQQLHSEENQKS